MEKDARFWSRIAEKYAATPLPDEAVYRKKIEVTQEYLRPDMNVFEFGCGTGSTSIIHAPKVRYILAIDIADGMLEIAERKAREQQISNLEFKRASIEELEIERHSFDAVLGLSILHLLKDKDQVIAKAFRILKPNGVFITSTTCIADFFKFHKLLTWCGPFGRFIGLLPRVNAFGREELEASIKSAGFHLEYKWQPEGKGKAQAVFIVARKPDTP